MQIDYNKFLSKISNVYSDDEWELIISLLIQCKADVKAGAIDCYFASPLALREQYGTEMKINLSERMKWYREDGIAIELFDYIEYLEGLLCKVEGE